MICNEDEILQKPSSGNDLAKIANAISLNKSITKCEVEAQSSNSEGYQSAEEVSSTSSPRNLTNFTQQSLKKRPSMENIRKSREEFCSITEEQVAISFKNTYNHF